MPFLTDNALGRRKQKAKKMELGKSPVLFLCLQNSKSYHGSPNNARLNSLRLANIILFDFLKNIDFSDFELENYAFL
ncbi:hypothetical protein ATZ36_07700 [Candidatus Endomicrobiellum trichonymphae]|uniref:Uncharacterized protein n=1 Tax=Endomicrobium trichonymphae TaxID=1408204 RepID=A0A1E5IH53_ENDTX|nr:hypothetical protein ATZ36_07700 [Candidatus Endomicrobium trichonymphae]